LWQHSSQTERRLTTTLSGNQLEFGEREGGQGERAEVLVGHHRHHKNARAFELFGGARWGRQCCSRGKFKLAHFAVEKVVRVGLFGASLELKTWFSCCPVWRTSREGILFANILPSDPPPTLFVAPCDRRCNGQRRIPPRFKTVRKYLQT
jgi:hypothetical protein